VKKPIYTHERWKEEKRGGVITKFRERDNRGGHPRRIADEKNSLTLRKKSSRVRTATGGKRVG